MAWRKLPGKVNRRRAKALSYWEHKHEHYVSSLVGSNEIDEKEAKRKLKYGKEQVKTLKKLVVSDETAFATKTRKPNPTFSKKKKK